MGSPDSDANQRAGYLRPTSRGIRLALHQRPEDDPKLGGSVGPGLGLQRTWAPVGRSWAGRRGLHSDPRLERAPRRIIAQTACVTAAPPRACAGDRPGRAREGRRRCLGTGGVAGGERAGPGTGGWQEVMGLARGGENADGRGRCPRVPVVRRAARPSYRQIWMADGVSAAGSDMLAVADV